MNEARRKILTGAAKELAELVKEIGTNDFEKWAGKLESIKADLEGVKDEEDEAYENMSENLQGGEKGSRMQEVISELEDAMGSLDEIKESIEGAGGWVEALDDIIGKVEAARD